MRTHNRQCCSKNCINNPAGSGKVCGCPTGKTPCQDRCVTNCTSPKVLDTSTCQCVCPSGQVECNGACVSNQCGTTQIFNPTPACANKLAVPQLLFAAQTVHVGLALLPVVV
jgi:CXCXC repeat